MREMFDAAKIRDVYRRTSARGASQLAARRGSNNSSNIRPSVPYLANTNGWIPLASSCLREIAVAFSRSLFPPRSRERKLSLGAIQGSRMVWVLRVWALRACRVALWPHDCVFTRGCIRSKHERQAEGSNVAREGERTMQHTHPARSANDWSEPAPTRAHREFPSTFDLWSRTLDARISHLAR